MKSFSLFFAMLFMATCAFAQQNQSDGQIGFNILTPPQQFGGQEIFRFQRGLVTQLNSGDFQGFDPNDIWFSLGLLDTGSQRVFGLRFQAGRKALTFGYNDLGNKNPRIQWIGDPGQNTLGNLQFRVADDFTSTNSRLVATMRKDGSTIFGRFPNLSIFDKSKVGILIGSVYRKTYILEQNHPLI